MRLYRIKLGVIYMLSKKELTEEDIKLKYITQAKTRPPSFYIFSSNPEGLPDSYLRYLVNSLRDTFNLGGVPIRITVRKSDNPYAR